MSEGTFNPDASMHYQMDAVMNMQASLMNEEMVNSLGLIKVSNAMQEVGSSELSAMYHIYNDTIDEWHITYAATLGKENQNTTNGGVYTKWFVEYDKYSFKDPGWGSTGANEETSAVASVEQEYCQMITTSEKSISSAFQQMISQDKQSENSLSSFAQNGFLAQKSYSANLMASNLG
ncbi:MAG: hypothetical protein KFB95_09180 [Simkaniaceae bacterium]|nr:MAG: hypothetical protein KFB95_09180 [Simkaniaceae bacterium]